MLEPPHKIQMEIREYNVTVLFSLYRVCVSVYEENAVVWHVLTIFLWIENNRAAHCIN